MFFGMIIILVFMVTFSGYQVLKTRKEKELSFLSLSTEVIVKDRTFIAARPSFYIINYVDNMDREGRLCVLEKEGLKLKQGEAFLVKIINNKAHLADEKYDRKITISFLCGLFNLLFLLLWVGYLQSYKAFVFTVAVFVFFILMFVFLYKRQMSRGMN
ncbi:MAG: hypothetical protein K5662_02260 [Lachnospiraceae bacterium]|nr:hypothetical protein [Lachnospiraceae bacterium]